ncbi:MAG: nucleoside deaminase [Planctomycetota bacterium]|nr:nucleoside deaminase [Planctomycetota bacterium]
MSRHDEQDRHFMQRAIALAREVSLERGEAGPFGCVIVKEGEIVAEGVNRVLIDHDPTAHGEMVALRAACRALGTHHLGGCTVYTSSEPCPMCYAACWWARVDAIRCASTIDDAHRYGHFDDRPILDALALPPDARPLPVTQLCHEEMLKVWHAFRDRTERPHY